MDAVPSPFAGVDTFEKLMKQSDFKDYLTRNLDSEYLISSILADDIDGDAFVGGIEQYRSLTPALRESLINRINNFELATTAGIDVSIHMIISFWKLVYLSANILVVPFPDISTSCIVHCLLPTKTYTDMSHRYLESGRT